MSATESGSSGTNGVDSQAGSRRDPPSGDAERRLLTALRDPSRLAALRATGLLEADRIDAFERVVRLAAHALRAPLAQVNLVTDDAQIPAAAHVEPPLVTAAWRAPVGLDYSYCQYVVGLGAPLRITDAVHDPLVASNLGTIASGIGAYLAVPLRTPANHVLGSVCVVDFAPREWTERDVAILDDLAAVAAMEIALRVVGGAAADGELSAERTAALATYRAERRAAELAAVLESVPDAVYVGTRDGTAIMNQAALDQVGATDRASLVQPIDESLDTPFARALRGERVVAEIVVPHQRTRERRVLRTAAGPIHVDGRLIGAVTVSTDVTDDRRAEQELRAAKDAAEAASRTKSDFLAVMSHELRTPLNAIGGYTELLELGLRGPLNDAQRSDLARIQKSQQQLLGLIEHVLDYARMERGARPHDVADVLLSDAIAAGEATIAPQLQARDLSFHTDAIDSRLTVRADAEALQQILINLLGNAAKFTGPGGRVTVRCDVSPTHVSLHVIDTGRGIARADFERIFEPFVQVDSRLTRAHDGIGLGLAISRDLARSMGGELTVASTLGTGSTFTLRLPRR